MKRLRPLEWAVIGFVCLVLATILWPVHPYDGSARRTACLSNLKQSSLALIMYEEDSDERFPLRDSWMDATYPYTKTERIWHCPSVPKGAYGYAFNALLSAAKPPKSPAETPMAYESVNPIRNASDRVASLPSPGRHGGKDNLAYADGHAKGIPPETVVR